MRGSLSTLASVALLFSAAAKSYAQAPAPVDSPVGCGELCLTAGPPTPSPVGCPGGFCLKDDYSYQVGALGYPPTFSSTESLSLIESSPAVLGTAPELAVTRKELSAGIAQINTTHRICTSRADAPERVWREALIQRPGLLACDKAARPLLEQREHNAENYFAFLSGAVTRQAHTFKELIRSYKDSCLQLLDQVGEAAPFRALFGNEFLQRLRDNVGTLVGRSGGSAFQCTAAVVEISKAPKKVGLLTAGHCMGGVRAMGTDSSQIVSIPDSLLFTSLAGKKIQIQINQDVKGWMFPRNHDLAILPASSDLSAQFQGLPLGNPDTLKGWDPIYLVGINPVIMALARADRTDGSEVQPSAAATISLSSPCRVMGLDRGRLVHNCETEKQMSGSPVFAMSSKGPVVVAVHTGGEIAPERLAACGPESFAAINQAVIVPFKD